MIAKYFLNKNTLIALAIFGLITFIYLRDQDQKNRIKNLSRENEILQLSNEQYQKTLKKINEDVEKVKQANNRVIQLNQKLSSEKRELEKTLFRERQGKKSLEKIANKAPSKIEYRVNSATKKELRCLEIASGDNYNESEKSKYSDCIPSRN